MIYLSIPVHEQIPVIVNQLQNFAAFAPEACVVLHRSAQAAFETEELNARLTTAGLSNFAVNPLSVPTAWASIIAAHLANIQFIRQRGDATQIGFHSSNDMLVRGGAIEFIESKRCGFHDWPVFSDSYCWVAQQALRDEVLSACLRHLGQESPITGQIEGSFYPADVLFDIADLAAEERFSIARPGPKYPREEIWFPSLARALGAQSKAFPYIFSEVRRFDRRVWRMAKISTMLPRGLGRHALRRGIINVCSRIPSVCYAIRVGDVEAIRSGGVGLEAWREMPDGDRTRRMYDVSALFGVKRVARSCDDALRRYITNLQPHAVPPIAAYPGVHQEA